MCGGHLRGRGSMFEGRQINLKEAGTEYKVYPFGRAIFPFLFFSSSFSAAEGGRDNERVFEIPSVNCRSTSTTFRPMSHSFLVS